MMMNGDGPGAVEKEMRVIRVTVFPVESLEPDVEEEAKSRQ